MDNTRTRVEGGQKMQEEEKGSTGLSSQLDLMVNARTWNDMERKYINCHVFVNDAGCL